MIQLNKIMVDALPLMSDGGVSNYVRPLLSSFAGLPGTIYDLEYFFRLGFRRHRYKLFSSMAAGINSDATSHFTGWPDRMAERFWLDWGCPGRRPSVFLSTTEFVPYSRSVSKIWIVYDLVPARIPQFFPDGPGRWLQSMRSMSERADYIVAISETTKRDVVDLLGYPGNRVEVVYPGNAPQFGECPRSNLGIVARKRPYVCYMGALALNKNVDGLLRVFAKCVHEFGVDCDLVMTGRNFCSDSYWMDMARDLKVADRILVKGWVSEDERREILSGARMLWQFSWYEGFGLPVLEAAACGIPVLYSNRGALKEILLNPDQEIDPSDIPGTADRAANALMNDTLLRNWSEHGLLRAGTFSWTESSTKLLAVVNLCAEKARKI